jgi:Rps23 Pro-64 3,4-dihydroxylase Tpa1-like proline 4-hydroxylase
MSEQRDLITGLVVDKLASRKNELTRAWRASKPVRHLVVDDLLPEDLAARVSRSFPAPADLLLKSSLRERKRVGVQVEKYDPIIADALYAFQQRPVVDIVAEITAIGGMIADPTLYAGGISVMGQDDFLNPHIDNSHDGEQKLYRVVNLLYYTSRDWKDEYGGHLELWDKAVRDPVRVACRFNRLAIMETDRASWHSVCRVTGDATRQCVSNYYFAPAPADGAAYRHVTTFTGRPEEPVKRLLLGLMDGLVLNTVGRTFPSLLKRNRHRRRTPK